METAIFMAIQKFQKETKLIVKEVDINKVFGGSGSDGLLIGVFADVRL